MPLGLWLIAHLEENLQAATLTLTDCEFEALTDAV
jgi:aryl-alcohol dehydrogenase-like predicted oxidoreductase